jgi:integrase
MSTFKRPGSEYWQYDFQFQGARFQGVFNGKDGLPEIKTNRPKKEADAAEALIRELAKQPAQKRQDARLTLREACDAYFEEKVKGIYADEAGELGRLNHLKRLIGAGVYLDDIDENRLAKYAARRRGEKARNKRTRPSEATINRELECYRRIVRRAHKVWKVRLTEDPIDYREIKGKERERERHLLEDETEPFWKAVETIRPDMFDLIAAALGTGKRVTELRTLEKRMVDRRGKIATLRQKGDRPNRVLLTPAMLEIIDRNWMNPTKYVFTFECRRNRTYRDKTGEIMKQIKGERYPYSKNGWRKDWAAILEAAGIQDFRFHDLRHTFATRLIAKSNLKYVQTALGHADISSTARYAETKDDVLREAMMAAEDLPQSPAKVPQKKRQA